MKGDQLRFLITSPLAHHFLLHAGISRALERIPSSPHKIDLPGTDGTARGTCSSEGGCSRCDWCLEHCVDYYGV